MNERPEYDIVIKAGEDFSFSFFLHDESGALEDLTGTTIRAQLRDSTEDEKALDFTCSHNGAGGNIILSMSHAKTQRIRFRSGVYDVFRYNGDGTRKCVLGGKAIVIPCVTR